MIETNNTTKEAKMITNLQFQKISELGHLLNEIRYDCTKSELTNKIRQGIDALISNIDDEIGKYLAYSWEETLPGSQA